MTATDRMQENTAKDVQRSIDHRTEDGIDLAVRTGRIDERLGELNREWDAERVLFTASGLNALLGLVLGRWVNRRWYLYTAVVGAFQFQHGVQGWCPPLAVIRRLKVRTRHEIETERAALKAIRGDYRQVGPGSDSSIALEAARR